MHSFNFCHYFHTVLTMSCPSTSRTSPPYSTQRLAIVSSTDISGDARDLRPRDTWVQQLEVDTGLSADPAWNIADNCCNWRVQQPPPVMGEKISLCWLGDRKGIWHVKILNQQFLEGVLENSYGEPGLT